jgi:hypothetical protein
MPVETPSIFAQVIEDHLRLKDQNAELETNMPLGRYKSADPFENHPLFKSEEQARIEETMDGEERLPEDLGPLTWVDEEREEPEVAHAQDSGLWSKSRDFDWGD